MLAKRIMSVTQLTEGVEHEMANALLLKNGRVKAIKLSILDKICKLLNFQPEDILEYKVDNENVSSFQI